MSSKIDERIVAMKFNNAQFEKGVADTNKSLEALKKGLNLGGAAKGLNDLDAAGKNFSLANLANGVESIASKFGALSVIGITALANIASRAVDTGLTLVRSLTVDPIKAGLDEYELKMGSIQTILSNTARYGTSLGEVTGALDELNTYADKTIYNFGDMTKNIGLFTNAGLRVEDATSMIKGFSNEAAASGTNAQGAASAAYQLSQALSAGTIRLMDWRSLQNVGMGNKNMQNGLIEIASAMGQFTDETGTAEEVSKDFNGSLEKGWLSADVMSKYLQIMAGDMDAAAMAALGLNDEQIAMFQTQQKNAEEAATKVRTYTQLVGTLQESVGSAWSETFDILVGDFNEATELWTNVNNVLGDMIGKSGEARNALLQSWKDQGGRDLAIEAVANAFKAVMGVITPVKEAFRDIFPPLTAEQLVNITKAVRDFTASLIPSEAVMDQIKRTFKGVFAVLDIGRMILVGAVEMFGRLFSGAGEGAAGILDFTAKVGDWLVKVRDAIKNGEGLSQFFQGLEKVIRVPLDLLERMGKATIDFISVDDWAQAWDNVANALKKVGEFFQPVMQFLGEAFQNLKKGVTEFFQSADPNILVGILNAGALGAVGVLIKKLIDAIKGMFDGVGGGIFDTIKGAFGQLTDTMGAMQDKLKADALMRIAIAIGLLTAAVVALSFVDTGKLFISLGAMATMFGMLAGFMAIMDRVVASKGFMKMPAISAAMIGMATAMVIFASAVLIMSTMEWDELARGMAGMAVGLGLLVGASALMQKMSARLIFAAPAMVLISGALLILAGALKIFATMSWDDMARAGVTLAGTLGILAGAMSLIHSKVFAAASMVIIAVAVNILAGAMKVFSTMSWDDIFRSMTVFAGAMVIMVGAMALMGALGGPGLIGAAAMIIVAGAITILAGALKIMATMSWDDIGRSLVVMAGGLAILAGAMALMGIPLVMAGSIGILAAAVAMMAIAPALKLLGTMSWDDIGRGLTVLAGALVILAAGGILLIPAIPAFLALGTAALLIGVGALAAGAGMIMMAAGITALAAAAAVGSEAIKMAVMTIISLIPMAMAAFAQGIIDFATVFATGGAQFTAAMTTLIVSMINALNATAPLLIQTLTNIISQLLTSLETLVPQFVSLGTTIVMSLTNAIVILVPFLVDAGLRLITGILNGIANNIGKIVDAGTNIIVNFIDGISRNLPRVIQSGFDLIVNFVNGLANAIRQNTSRMEDAGRNLASAIIDGMVGGISRGVQSVINAAKRMAESALNAAKNFLGINSPSKEFDAIGNWSTVGMAKGLVRNLSQVERAGTTVGETALYATQKSIDKIASAVATDIDITPTIRPVLDLSAIKKDANLIGGMLQRPSLAVDNNYATAASLSAAYRANNQPPEDSEGGNGSGGVTLSLTQNNYSPKALSNAEIYRNSKNLISRAKGELDAANR